MPDQIDDLNVVKANDRRLGLTNRGKKRPEDWVADTGPTRNPDSRVDDEALGRRESTLSPRRSHKI